MARPRDRSAHILARAALAAGSVALFAGAAQAYDRERCNWLFGAANVFKAETFNLNTSSVDFGDDPHLGGGPLGTAVVCWDVQGRVAVSGRLYADSRSDEVLAVARISYMENGNVRATTNHSVFGNFAASRKTNESTQGAANFDQVRVRLFLGRPDGTVPAAPILTRNFFR